MQLSSAYAPYVQGEYPENRMWSVDASMRRYTAMRGKGKQIQQITMANLGHHQKRGCCRFGALLVVGPWPLGPVTDGGFDLGVTFNSNPRRYGVIGLDKFRG